MTLDRSFQAQNQIERERLKAVVARLSDADLTRLLPGDWTIAAGLAHVAFWDRRALLLLERFEREGKLSASPYDADLINDAMKVHCLALPPRIAVQIAIDSAEAIDRKLDAISDAWLAELAAAGNPANPNRWIHRREHLDEIERVLTTNP
jgi:hypothetical protein